MIFLSTINKKREIDKKELFFFWKIPPARKQPICDACRSRWQSTGVSVLNGSNPLGN
jgi:hypothetical protein